MSASSSTVGSRDARNPEEAVKFINWFNNSTKCNDILLGERGVLRVQLGLPRGDLVQRILQRHPMQADPLRVVLLTHLADQLIEEVVDALDFAALGHTLLTFQGGEPLIDAR